MDLVRIIIDTNVYVAAGFQPGSISARIINEVERGRIAMVWHESTRSETRHILTQIPRLSWDAVAQLFRPEYEYAGVLDIARYNYIQDKADRKYAALADACGITLVTNDTDLLSVRCEDSPEILTPVEFWDFYGKQKTWTNDSGGTRCGG